MDLLVYSQDILNLTEIIKHRLYFAVVTPGVQLEDTADTVFFNVDNEYVYLNFYYDFGPLNISWLYKYCYKINTYLQSKVQKRIVHCTSAIPQTKANAAFLIGCFAVIYLRVHPREITKALVSGCVHFMPFADASQGGSDWKITLIDCFGAIQKAFSCGFVNFADFDVVDYDNYDKLQNGDINWLLPNKFLAFIGPTDLELLNYHPPDFYIQYFLENDVKVVIRLNNNTYNSAVFTSVGIEHYDLFFPDGTVPPKNILLHFLNICEKTNGAIAVHCKAGLGRTGSLIGAYIIKHYRFTAREAIAWLRICRPGSVIGQQQGWLEHMESWLWRQGNYYRYQHFNDCNKIHKNKYGIYSIQWKNERYKLNMLLKKEMSAKYGASNSTYSGLPYNSSAANSSKVLADNTNVKKQIINQVRLRTVNNSQVEDMNKTQGDKLNVLKFQKVNKSCMIHPPPLRNKNHVGAKKESLRKK